MATAVEGPNDETRVAIMEAPNTFKSTFMCALTSLSGIFVGYNAFYGKGSLGLDPFTVNLSPRAAGIIYVLSAGAVFGAVTSGDVSDRIGRRYTIILGSTIGWIGAVVQTAVLEYRATVITRFVSGVSLGFVSATVVTYLCELSPSKFRGMIIAFYNFAMTIGLLLALCVCYETREFGEATSYRITTAVQILWSLLLTMGLLYQSESPRYLVKQGKLIQANRAHARIRGQTQTTEEEQIPSREVMEMVAHHEHHTRQRPQGRYFTDWANCFRGEFLTQRSYSNLRRTMLGVSLMMLQQLSGINALLNFITVSMSGMSQSLNPFTISLIPTMMSIGSMPLSFWTIEMFGRRSALLWGSSIMLVCQWMIGILGAIDGERDSTAITEHIFACIALVTFSVTWGPVTWTLIGEIFPPTIRSRAVGLSTASYWLWNAIVWILLPYLMDSDSIPYAPRIFFLWGGFCGCGYVFAFFLVPETKGLTLEQIDLMLEATIPRLSAVWTPTTTFVARRGTDNEGSLQDAGAIEEGHKLENVPRSNPVAS